MTHVAAEIRSSSRSLSLGFIMDEPGDPRSRLLRQVWAEVRSSNEVNVLNYPSVRRAVEAGAAPSDLVKAMTAAAYETAFRLLFLISAEHAEEDARDARTGWALTEADIDPSAVPHPISIGP